MNQQSDTPNNSGHDPSLEDITRRLDGIEELLRKLSVSTFELHELSHSLLENFMKRAEPELEEMKKNNDDYRKWKQLEAFERGTELFLPPPYIDDDPDDDQPCRN